jgi:hypothetical protein
MISVSAAGQDASGAASALTDPVSGMRGMGVRVGKGDVAGVSGSIRLVAVRQAKVRRRSGSVHIMSLNMERINKERNPLF